MRNASPVHFVGHDGFGSAGLDTPFPKALELKNVDFWHIPRL